MADTPPSTRFFPFADARSAFGFAIAVIGVMATIRLLSRIVPAVGKVV